ncbi:MAG: hypothetical protein ABSG41_07835 [Bryobacteraceae bacterium]|jgi:hypothetical protein
MKALVLALILVSSSQAEDPLVWGEVNGGVRLGIGLGPTTPQPTLRLVFENTAKPDVQLPVGEMTAKGPIYNVVFRITSPAGKEYSLFDLNGPTGPTGKIDPLVAHLARGQKYEILLTLNKLVYLDNNAKSRSLPEMLAAHYSVRAMLDTSGEPRQLRSFPLWFGNVSSGEFRH